MSLTRGTRIGVYEVTGVLGAGGMGEVYRARDTKLGRDVALKVISDAFALDPDRLARFRREAQVLASLNHPHIGAIYGLEDSGDTHALVLELVEGDTLADRIARGPLPLDEALPIARQIAEALEAAHEHGIIHRDLKPANIKVTPDGVVKVLDFGLAKLTGPAESGPHRRPDFSQSPTITSPAMMTGIGTLLGTAAYMSPEQAKGREADKRSDVWAFGCVLYEMLTARRAFDGEDMTEVLAAVVRAEPDWVALPSDVPPAVRTLLHRCLVKDRRARIADVAAALFVLDHQATMAPASEAALARPSPGPRWRRIAVLTAGAAMVAGLAVTLTWLASRPPPPPVVVTTITPSGSAALTLQGFDRDIAITPDGSRIVYRGSNQLLVRALDRLEPTVLSGLGAPRGVFVSPDGQWVGFVDGTTMKKVAITGGPPETICAIPETIRGATWSEDGTIIFATASATGLHRVSETGGEPTVLTTPDREREGDHVWPEFLPGGGAVLFTITPPKRSIENAQIAVLDLQTKRSKVLIRGASHALYVPSGHLVYAVAGTLRAVAFDLGRLEVVGTAAAVLEGLMTTESGAAQLAVATSGSLVYIAGGRGRSARQTVVAVDRQGSPSPLPGLPPDAYRDVRVSSGGRLALTTQNDLLTYDFNRAAPSRLITDSPNVSPLWTPDRQRIVYTSRRAGYPELFWRRADGTGSEDRLATPAKNLVDLVPNGWSADGKHLLFTQVPQSGRCAISHLAIEDPADDTVLVQDGSFCTHHATVSPDGHWMAYESNRDRQPEIYVERYPELGNRIPISTGGGRIPMWSPDGRELFFGSLDGRRMFAVAMRFGTTLVAERPRVLFEFAMPTPVGGSRPYDLAPDGRFVIIRSGEADAAAATPQIVVVQNWFEELKRLVPVN